MMLSFVLGMPCIHAIAAIRKRHDHPEDYVHPWLCMESIHKTYAHCIQPVPSEEFWTRTEYTRPDPPIIKRPIGRPKVHNRQKDPAEPMTQQGDKLKRSFKVTCSKCGSTGHNYKTCKGAPSNPNWKPMAKKPKKCSTSQSLAVIPLSQSAPNDSDAPSTQDAPPTHDAPSGHDHDKATQQSTPALSTQGSSGVIPGPSNPVAATQAALQVRPGPATRRTPFRPPLQVPSTAAQKSQATPPKMRPKQKIFRPPAPLCPSPQPPQSQPNAANPQQPQVLPGTSAAATQETLAAAGTTTSRLFKFIPNPPTIVPKK
ncbi:uncharacterized protein [Arachis hypogaea]|uniref:uncharacterized protein n=1 Tax=Arachis hypogaea TaxID=3818 RepID=UPI003B214B1E